MPVKSVCSWRFRKGGRKGSDSSRSVLHGWSSHIGVWLWEVSYGCLAHFRWVLAMAAATEVAEYAVAVTHVANSLGIVVSTVVWGHGT